MGEQTIKVLEMLEEGKVTVEEAQALLEATADPKEALQLLEEMDGAR